MDWNAIIMMLLGGTTVGGVVSAIWYRKQNKTIKESEATQADVEAQKAEIDLANKYRDEMLNMMNVVKESNEKNFTNQDEIIKGLRRLDERMEQMEIKVGDIESYLNGPYHQYIAEKQSRYNPNIHQDEAHPQS
jgi:hypothetical protein